MKYYICTEGEKIGVVCSSLNEMSNEWTEIDRVLYKMAYESKEDIILYYKYRQINLPDIFNSSWIYPKYVKITGRTIAGPHPCRHLTYNEFRAIFYTDEFFRNKIMEKKLKQVFLSIPMSGCLNESKVKEKEAKEKLKAYFPDTNIISGFDLNTEENQTDAYYMGIDIKALLESDAIVSMPGWVNSKGCQVERYAAKIYGLDIFDYDNMFQSIKYVKGDVTLPIVKEGENSIICHCCNCQGAWGKGVVVPIGKRYPAAKEAYFKAIKEIPLDERLGEIITVKVTDNILVSNMFGQFDYRKRYEDDKDLFLNYEALGKCFEKLKDQILAKRHIKNYTIHMPRIGCGLAGGDWNVVEKLINDIFIINGISVTVYDLD